MRRRRSEKSGPLSPQASGYRPTPPPSFVGSPRAMVASRAPPRPIHELRVSFWRHRHVDGSRRRAPGLVQASTGEAMQARCDTTTTLPPDFPHCRALQATHARQQRARSALVRRGASRDGFFWRAPSLGTGVPVTIKQQAEEVRTWYRPAPPAAPPGRCVPRRPTWPPLWADPSGGRPRRWAPMWTGQP